MVSRSYCSSAAAGSSRLCMASEILLRVLALLLSLAAALVMGKNKEDTVVHVGEVPLTLYARHSYIKAFVFLVYANAIVSIYSFLALITRPLLKGRAITGFLLFMDQALAYLLLAAAAAATEVSYIAKNGEEKVLWAEVCSNFEAFCNRVGVCLVLSFLCVLAMAVLAILAGRRVFGLGSSPPPPPSDKTLPTSASPNPHAI